METNASVAIVDEVKEQWQRLWRDRIDDKVKAEGIASTDFSLLFVDKGTVIFATRDFKALNLREILELHKVGNVDRLVPPSPQVGGWGKFIRTVITSQRPRRPARGAQQLLNGKKQRQQLKKGGKGWLHF